MFFKPFARCFFIVICWAVFFPLVTHAKEKDMKEIIPETHGLEKICGVWEMTVHNMLNHKEYKYMLHVPPSPDTGVVPSKLIVNGQTVYIRWDFPGGFSEESLLLRRTGGVMEGTFINFAGARGGVSGKLINSCVSADE